MMKTFAKTLFYAFALSMTMSCSGSTSSSSDDAQEIVDSIQIHQIDDNVNILEVYDMGSFPAGEEIPYATVICNFDSVKGAKIISIEGDNLVTKCNPSLDSIEPGMLISVDFRLKVPEEKGSFDAIMRIHYNNVKNPSIIKLHGTAK